MSVLLAAFLFGVVAGLRSMTAPAIASWAVAQAWTGDVHGWPAFMEYRWTPVIFTVAALGEWVTDQLPWTPSRTVPVQFAARLATGALAGATIGSTHNHLWAGLGAGVLGAFVGTFGGAAGRASLARALSNDHVAAFAEDAVALGIGAIAVLVAS
jgi:uncharacterized membrane protein